MPEVMRVFISVPMHNRSMSDVDIDIQEAKKDVVDSLNEFSKMTEKNIVFEEDDIEWLTGLDKPEEVDERIKTMNLDENQTRLYLLSDSLMTLATCDFIYFCKGFENARGCVLELLASEAYNIGCLNKTEDLTEGLKELTSTRGSILFNEL